MSAGNLRSCTAGIPMRNGPSFPITGLAFPALGALNLIGQPLSAIGYVTRQNFTGTAMEGDVSNGVGRQSTQSNGYKGVSKPVMIAGRIKALLASYRRDDYADPEGFIAQVGALMERHRESVIAAATDPTNSRSIQRKHQ